MLLPGRCIESSTRVLFPITLWSITHEGVINRHVWFCHTKQADLVWMQVCLSCVRYCYAGVIELLCLAGCIGDPSILYNADEANAYVYCRRQHRAYRLFCTTRTRRTLTSIADDNTGLTVFPIIRQQNHTAHACHLAHTE